jgi:TRAP-type C4-dicarboxylate transport system permease large subunit
MNVASWIAPLPMNRYVILTFFLLLFMGLGCRMDTLAIIMLVVPIIFPTIMKLGFDPIWLGVIMVKVSEIGLITPPVGLNVYVVKAAAPDVPLTTIFKGVFPFLIADIINTIVLILFPQLSLWLPSMMK